MDKFNSSHHLGFNADQVIERLRHYIPDQNPLKDFIHHNPLHAYQKDDFFTAMYKAHSVLGYNTFVSLKTFHKYYEKGKISAAALEQSFRSTFGEKQATEYLQLFHNGSLQDTTIPQIGKIRSLWKSTYKFDLDGFVHPLLFRLLSSYLDQGMADWKNPATDKGLLDMVRTMETNSLFSIFKSEHVKSLLFSPDLKVETLLHLLVSEEKYFETYLFDQQFEHPGWSGFIIAIEAHPENVLYKRAIRFEDAIILELLIELEMIERYIGAKSLPPQIPIEYNPLNPDEVITPNLYMLIQTACQKALEWSYYDQVLSGIQQKEIPQKDISKKSFQAVFCIDDRECSIRRYLELFDPHCATYGTPGFFNVEFYYLPKDGNFLSKQCPAPVQPKFIVRELNTDYVPPIRKEEAISLPVRLLKQFIKNLFAIFLLFYGIFRHASRKEKGDAFLYMSENSELLIEKNGELIFENYPELISGFTVQEMADRVEGQLRSIGLVENFSPIIYIVGHGSGTVNNPHYAAYDCGACSGRPGSVNARVFSYMANHKEVRDLLKEKQIVIPDQTLFVGAIHDTTKDLIQFYDAPEKGSLGYDIHIKNSTIFDTALDYNSKERSRRFESVDTAQTPERVHRAILDRSISLFQPRPELNHATNALCIVGRRDRFKNIFLDRRAFMNSYDYSLDKDGVRLAGIINAAAPVCGGINLEYYFSRVDNEKLGAGSKLPHNVIGLFAVANGVDGDLRSGLPMQMIDIHDPLRLMMIIEHFPEVVLHVLDANPKTKEWFQNNWIHLVVLDPNTNECLLYQNEKFIPAPFHSVAIPRSKEFIPLLEKSLSDENLPVTIIE